MARIDWKVVGPNLIELLHTGKLVEDAAKEVGISYSSACKYLRDLSMNSEGKFKERINRSDQLEEFFINNILGKEEQIVDISEKYGMSPAQVQYWMRIFKKRKQWNFAKSSSINVRNGRKAELFVMNQRDFMVLRDANKNDSKAPFDLVLRPNHSYFNHWQGIDTLGGVDVKATHLRETENNGHRWKFNVGNIQGKSKRQIKYVFLVGYDSTFNTPMILLVVPFDMVKKCSSVSVSLEKLKESKYNKYVYKKYQVRNWNKLIEGEGK